MHKYTSYIYIKYTVYRIRSQCVLLLIILSLLQVGQNYILKKDQTLYLYSNIYSVWPYQNFRYLYYIQCRYIKISHGLIDPHTSNIIHSIVSEMHKPAIFRIRNTKLESLIYYHFTGLCLWVLLKKHFADCLVLREFQFTLFETYVFAIFS